MGAYHLSLITLLVSALATLQLGEARRVLDLKTNVEIAFKDWDPSIHPNTLLTMEEIIQDLNEAREMKHKISEDRAKDVCKLLKGPDVITYSATLMPVYFEFFKTNVITLMAYAFQCTYTRERPTQDLVLGVADIGDGKYLLSRYFKGMIMNPALRKPTKREGFAYFGTTKLDTDPPSSSSRQVQSRRR